MIDSLRNFNIENESSICSFFIAKYEIQFIKLVYVQNRGLFEKTLER